MLLTTLARRSHALTDFTGPCRVSGMRLLSKTSASQLSVSVWLVRLSESTLLFRPSLRTLALFLPTAKGVRLLLAFVTSTPFLGASATSGTDGVSDMVPLGPSCTVPAITAAPDPGTSTECGPPAFPNLVCIWYDPELPSPTHFHLAGNVALLHDMLLVPAGGLRSGDDMATVTLVTVPCEVGESLDGTRPIHFLPPAMQLFSRDRLTKLRIEKERWAVSTLLMLYD